MYFMLAKKEEDYSAKKVCHHTDFEADPWPETGDFILNHYFP